MRRLCGEGSRSYPMGWTPPPADGIDVPEWKCQPPLDAEGASTLQITTIGVDPAKNVFQVHGANEHGDSALKAETAQSNLTRSLKIS